MICLRCAAPFSGPEYNELCNPCQRRMHQRSYNDPRTLDGWKRNLEAEIRTTLMRMHGRPLIQAG